MSPVRKDIKVLGLSLMAALSVMALTAGAARAIEFNLASKTFTSDGTASEGILGTAGLGILLTRELKLEFHCKGSTIQGTVLLGGVAHAHVLFEGCLLSVKGTLNKFCITYPTAADMVAKTNAGKMLAEGLGEVINHNGVYYFKASSAAFITIFMSPPPCLLPLENAVSGGVAFKLPLATTESLNHTIETITEAEETLLGVALSYGTEKANLDPGTTGSIMLKNDAFWSVK